MVENMRKSDLVLLKSGRYELSKAEDTTARKILFDRFMEDQYKMVMHHLRMAKDSEDFISRILEDPEMSGTYAYAYVSQNLRPSGHWGRVRGMFGARCIKTESDAGGVKIGNASAYSIVPNGVGDGTTRVAVFPKGEPFNASMMRYFGMIGGDDLAVYSYDCGDDIAVQLDGDRYQTYFYDGLVAIVEI